MNAAVAFLRGCAAADVSKLGIVGFCMGGRVACLMAAADTYFPGRWIFMEAAFTGPGRWSGAIGSRGGKSLPYPNTFR